MLTDNEKQAIVVCINIMEFLRVILSAHIELMKTGITPCPFMPSTEALDNMVKPISQQMIKLKDKDDLSAVLQSIMLLTKLIEMHDEIRICAHQENSH